MKCGKTAKTSTSGQYACEVPLPGEVSSVPGGTKASAKLQKPPVAVFGMPVKSSSVPVTKPVFVPRGRV